MSTPQKNINSNPHIPQRTHLTGPNDYYFSPSSTIPPNNAHNHQVLTSPSMHSHKNSLTNSNIHAGPPFNIAQRISLSSFEDNDVEPKITHTNQNSSSPTTTLGNNPSHMFQSFGKTTSTTPVFNVNPEIDHIGIRSKVETMISSIQANDNLQDQTSPLLLHLLYHKTTSMMRGSPILISYQDLLNQFSHKSASFAEKQQEYYVCLAEYESLIRHRDAVMKLHQYDNKPHPSKSDHPTANAPIQHTKLFNTDANILDDENNGDITELLKFGQYNHPQHSKTNPVSIRVTFDEDDGGPNNNNNKYSDDGNNNVNAITHDSSVDFDKNSLSNPDLLVLPSHVSEHLSIQFTDSSHPISQSALTKTDDGLSDLEAKIHQMEQQLNHLQQYSTFDTFDILAQLSQNTDQCHQLLSDSTAINHEQSQDVNHFNIGTTLNNSINNLSNKLQSLSTPSQHSLFTSLLAPLYESAPLPLNDVLGNDHENNQIDIQSTTSIEPIVDRLFLTKQALCHVLAEKTLLVSLLQHQQHRISHYQSYICELKESLQQTFKQRLLFELELEKHKFHFNHPQSDLNNDQNSLKSQNYSTSLKWLKPEMFQLGSRSLISSSTHNLKDHSSSNQTPITIPNLSVQQNELYNLIYSRVVSLVSELEISKELCIYLENHLSAQIAQLRTQLITYQDKYATTLHSLQYLEREVTSARNEINYWQNEYFDLLVVMEGFTSKLDSLQEKLLQRANTIDILQTKLIETQNSTRNKDSIISHQKKSLKEKDTIIMQLQEQLEQIQRSDNPNNNIGNNRQVSTSLTKPPQKGNITILNGTTTSSDDDDFVHHVDDDQEHTPNNDNSSKNNNHTDHTQTLQTIEPQDYEYDDIGDDILYDENIVNKDSSVGNGPSFDPTKTSLLDLTLFQEQLEVICCHCDGSVGVTVPFKYENLLTIDPNYLHKALLDLEFNFSTSVYANLHHTKNILQNGNGLTMINGVVLPYQVYQVLLPNNNDPKQNQIQHLSNPSLSLKQEKFHPLATTVSLFATIHAEEQQDWTSNVVIDSFLHNQFKLFSAQEMSFFQSIKQNYLGVSNSHDDDTLEFPDLIDSSGNPHNANKQLDFYGLGTDVESGEDEKVHDEWYIDGQPIDYAHSYTQQTINSAQLSTTKHLLWNGLLYLIKYSLFSTHHHQFCDSLTFSPIKKRQWIQECISSPHLTSHGFIPIFSMPIQLANQYNLLESVNQSGQMMKFNPTSPLESGDEDAYNHGSLTNSPASLRHSYHDLHGRPIKNVDTKQTTKTYTYTTRSSPALLTLYTQFKPKQSSHNHNYSSAINHNTIPIAPSAIVTPTKPGTSSLSPSQSSLHVVPILSANANAYLPHGHTIPHLTTPLVSSSFNNMNPTSPLFVPSSPSIQSNHNPKTNITDTTAMISESILTIVLLESGERIDLSLTNISLTGDLTLPLSVLTSTTNSTIITDNNDDTLYNDINNNNNQHIFSSQTRVDQPDPLLHFQQQFVQQQQENTKSGDKLKHTKVVTNDTIQQTVNDSLIKQRDRDQCRFEIKLLNVGSVYTDLLRIGIIPSWLTVQGQPQLDQSLQQQRMLKPEVTAITSPTISIPVVFASPEPSFSVTSNHRNDTPAKRSANLNANSSPLKTIPIINNAFGPKLTIQCATRVQKDLICDMLQAYIATRMGILASQLQQK